mmetsp:Transcript_44138/g.104456  ORF Transcript_44138/g.104456 Transcript_44138/m.104456 type:complete len:884 (-) Transcript_44138:172-2823(-)
MAARPRKHKPEEPEKYLEDLPAGHRAFKLVKVKRKAHPQHAFACFALAVARCDQRPMTAAASASNASSKAASSSLKPVLPSCDHGRLEQMEELRVRLGSVDGSQEHAARIARLCFHKAEAGASDTELLAFRKACCQETRRKLRAEAPQQPSSGTGKPGAAKGKRKSDDAPPASDNESPATVAAPPTKRLCQATFADLAQLRAAADTTVRRPPSELRLAQAVQEGPVKLQLPASYQRQKGGNGELWSQTLIDMMNAREEIAKRRKKGLAGPGLYEGIDEDFVRYFQCRQCPNVRRRDDRTTQGLHKLAAAEARFDACQSEQERAHMKRLFVLNFCVWRYVGGTIGFARQVGFLTQWSEAEKERIREVIWQAYREGSVAEVLSDAYASAGKLRGQLLGRCSNERLQAIFYNIGEKAMHNHGAMYFTLDRKLDLIDLVWRVAPAVVIKAAQKDIWGRYCWEPAMNELARVPYFGSTDHSKADRRWPGFFAKEILQDLLDTPIFPCGRESVKDLASFCPAGPGAQLGLMLCFDLRAKPTQSEAIPMMRTLRRDAQKRTGGWKHGDPQALELHDFQFMLCELQKYYHARIGSGSQRYYAPQRLTLQSVQHIRHCPHEAVAEALMLFGSAGPDCVVAMTREELFHAWAQWMSFPSPQQAKASSDPIAIRHGCWVRLRTLHGEAISLIRGRLSMEQQSEDPSSSADWFLVEREMGQGPVGFGDPFWLRAANGGHIGFEDTTCKGSVGVVALKKERFNRSAAWEAERWPYGLDGTKKRCIGRSEVLQEGQVIALRAVNSSSGPVRRKSALMPGKPCKAAPPASVGKDALVVLSSDSSSRQEVSDFILARYEDALKACIDRGVLNEHTPGRIKVVDPDRLHARLMPGEARHL